MTSPKAQMAFALACIASLAQPTAGQTQDAPSLRQVTSLHTARSVHTATTLTSGMVLIVGGMTGGGRALNSVELVDPAHNVVSELGRLAEHRLGHTATLLGDGRVLIAGGYNGQYLSSVEIFDPADRRLQVATPLAEARSGHTATLLPDGRVLFVGGVGPGWTFLRSAEIYDPRTQRAEQVGTMNVARESHTATLLADGQVLIVGGHSGRRPNVVLHSSAELFSPRTGRFESAGNMGTARHKHDAIGLADGRVLVIGGADRTDRVHYASTEIYDPRTRSFERGPRMAHRRYKIAGTSVLLTGGRVLVTSGAPVAEYLDPASWSFHEVRGRLPTGYRFAAATTLSDGDVLLSGGYSDSNEETAGIWRFRLR